MPIVNIELSAKANRGVQYDDMTQKKLSEPLVLAEYETKVSAILSPIIMDARSA